MRDRGPKQGHDAVAHHLIDRPLVAVHGLHHAFEDGIEDGPGFFRVAVSQQLHGAFEISEQDGDLLALACQAQTGLQDFFGQMWRGVRQRLPRLVGGRGRSWRRGRTGFSRPDQATAVVIDYVWVGVEEFVLERLQVVVIQTELEFEGAIGHAAASLEHGQRLIENLLEGHGRPSTTLALVPRESKVRQGGVYRKKAPRVYQEYGRVAGEIAPLGRDPGMGAIAKKPETFQQTANGLPPSGTFTHDPLNNYIRMPRNIIKTMENRVIVNVSLVNQLERIPKTAPPKRPIKRK